MNRPSAAKRTLAALGALGWLAATPLGLSVFVWADVEAVYLASACPLAWAVAAALSRLRPPSATALTMVGLASVGVLLMIGLPACVVRVVVALVLALPPALALVAWVGGAARPDRLVAALGAGALAVVPATYVGARYQREDARLGDLLAQSRIGEAAGLAGSLSTLEPTAERDGMPLAALARLLRDGVRSLESAVAAPLPAGSPPAERLDRARRLAMLGRPAEALAALGDADDLASLALRATVLETGGEWESALEAYRQAGREGATARTETGVAYCLRKLGRYGEAESAYLRVLALAPTADSHFLLAQFYEDAQQAGEARTHARRSMEMAPSRYQRRGEKLIAKLAVYQFGCLGVFRAESRPVGASHP